MLQVCWLDRVFNTATSHQRTRESTINLMIMASTGTAADYIRQMRDERRTPLEVVQALELRYGDLCLPEEAISRCGTMPRKDKFVAPPLIIRPLCDRGSPFQSFNILLGLNGILPFSPVEKGDVRGPPDPIMSNQGLLNCCCHRERSVVRCREEWREVAAPTAQTKLLLKSFVTFI